MFLFPARFAVDRSVKQASVLLYTESSRIRVTRAEEEFGFL